MEIYYLELDGLILPYDVNFYFSSPMDVRLHEL